MHLLVLPYKIKILFYNCETKLLFYVMYKETCLIYVVNQNSEGCWNGKGSGVGGYLVCFYLLHLNLSISLIDLTSWLNLYFYRSIYLNVYLLSIYGLFI